MHPAHAAACPGRSVGLVLVGLPFLQNRRQRGLIAKLEHGDDVVINNALVGKVDQIIDGQVEVEIAPKVRVRCLPGAVSRPR